MNKLFLLFTLGLAQITAGYADSTKDAAPLATVNGTPITQQEVKHFMSKLTRPVPVERALQEMINVELLVQAAQKDGLLKDEDLALEIKRTTSGIIASHYLQKALLNLDITLEELKQRYNKEYVEGIKTKEYNANHILVKTEQEAKDIIKQLDEGAKFTELAKQLSTGPSGKDGGALGWFKPGDMVAAFSQAAMALTEGQYTKNPVKTQFGWHIILLNKTRPVDPPSFESVSQKLSTAVAAEEINRIMKNLHDAAKIEINNDKK